MTSAAASVPSYCGGLIKVEGQADQHGCEHQKCEIIHKGSFLFCLSVSLFDIAQYAVYCNIDRFALESNVQHIGATETVVLAAVYASQCPLWLY